MTHEAVALALAALVCDVVDTTGGIPSGHLYARLMNVVPLEVYQAVVAGLVRAGRITNHHHYLAPAEAQYVDH